MDYQEMIDSFLEALVAFVPKLIVGILVLIIGMILTRILVKLFKSYLKKRNVDKSLITFLPSLLRFVLILAVLLTAIAIFGVKVTAFVAILGAAGFGVGMALQGSLGNFASGVLILVFRPFKIGDIITLQGKTGRVSDIQIFNTVLRTYQNELVIIPNAIVTSNIIVNISTEGLVRLDLTYGISYADDIGKAKSLLREIAEGCEQVLKDPEPIVAVRTLNNSSVEFDLMVWIDPEDMLGVRHFITEQVKRIFDQHEVSIPFPQMDVHHFKED